MAHIARVRQLLAECSSRIIDRAFAHDASKLEEPEKTMFDTVTGKLKGLTYGSEEYKASLTELKPALDHHYTHNSHHPEHYGFLECNLCFEQHPKDWSNQCRQCGNGGFTFCPNVAGMNLFDILEMLMDWKAAGERHTDGCIHKSLKINEKRFGISPQLMSILSNTVKAMGWEAKP